MGESAVERLGLEPGDVEVSEPSVVRHPPGRASGAGLADDVDPGVVHPVAHGVEVGVCWALPSMDAAIWWSKAKAFQANRPSGRSEAATRSKVRRRPSQACRWSRARNGQCMSAAGSSSERPRMTPSRGSSSTPASAARIRAWANIAGDESMPIMRWLLSRATGMGTRPDRRRARRTDHLPGEPARHRTRRRPSCAPATRRNRQRRPRPSSTGAAPALWPWRVRYGAGVAAASPVSCSRRLRASTSDQISAILPHSKRKMLIPVQVASRPEGGRSPSGPSCVPVAV